MVISFEITNHKDESLQLILKEPEKSGIIVKSVEGLGPPKANINTMALATTDGGIFVGSRCDNRNIKLTLLPMDIPSVETNRHKIYRYFQVKKPVTLRAVTDERNLTVRGYVESCEPNIFSNQEDLVISIICPDPWWYTDASSETSFSGVKNGFEFPFSNESLTEPLLHFGDIYIDTAATLIADGDAEVGMIITITCMAQTARQITLYDITRQLTMKINTDILQTIIGRGIAVGDSIIISTITGEKYARLVSGAKTYNIIGSIDRDSSWFKVDVGDNVFAFSAEEGQENLEVNFSYHAAYKGL